MKKLSREDFDSGIAVLISFVIYGLTLSAARLSSLLFVAAIPRYNVDRKRASFPFVLSYATRNSLGPLVGFCAKQFGIRAVTVFGCLLSAVAIGGCYFAEDIATITILWGIVYGGLMTVNTGLVSFYIDKEYHSVAVPSRIILYPPVSFTQAPLIGYFRDTLQSYDGLFYILIGVCCMSSAICLLIPQIIIWMRNRSK